ncbi:helix-turn-helix domain-containing protein [Lederbergia lenta]|uniref:helix-turn-helix domain-containing protein n=1 Tax=Lederbergia lenta TaxID=1467 RepID=UPI00203C8D9C|nr:helix-turn-helix domain-containing protein [Lederbergia lenta]MCM3110637.1 helix-turn-helix domain-containing protein [Lederbergia lenta]
MTNILATRLKELRSEKGYSLRQLARESNIVVDSIASFEQGKRIPKLEHINKIQKVFDVSLCYLIGKVDNKKEIIDISDEFEGFHINGYQNLSEDAIKSARLMASDSSLYMEWVESMTGEYFEFIDD